MEPRELDLEPAPLLQWLPDETLFSLASRLHGLWGHAQAWQTSLLLFGARRAGYHHDFPNALDALARRTQGQLGTVDQIARQRTLLRYYAPFLSAPRAAEIINSMRGESVAHLKLRLGLLTSRFRANHPLKACAQCMRADLTEHGWAYWHLQHQYPGVWVCRRHGELLAESTVKSTGVERFLWHLPLQATLRWPAGDTQLPETKALASLGSLIGAVIDADAPGNRLDVTHVEVLIRAECAARGWATRGRNLRVDAMARSYLHYCQRLQGPSELEALPNSLEDAKTQIGRLFRSLRDGTHPLRMLLALHWLFDDIAAFRAASAAIASEFAPMPVQPLIAGADESEPIDARRQRLAALLQSGLSPTGAARLIDVDVGTAIAWATQLGIPVSRRAKILKPPVLAGITADLMAGMDKPVAAQRHAVSLQAVTRVLRTEVGLHTAWRHAQQQAAQASARSAWEALLAEHAAMGIKLLRAMNPAVYAWLYRHDRAWLQQKSPPSIPRNRQVRQSSVRWDERDQWLCTAVEKAVLQLGFSDRGRALRLWQIYQAVPELKPKLRSLERLPLTRAVLERALRRPGREQDRGGLLS